jgi:hypothetical protein
VVNDACQEALGGEEGWGALVSAAGKKRKKHSKSYKCREFSLYV